MSVKARDVNLTISVSLVAIFQLMKLADFPNVKNEAVANMNMNNNLQVFRNFNAVLDFRIFNARSREEPKSLIQINIGYKSIWSKSLLMKYVNNAILRTPLDPMLKYSVTSIILDGRYRKHSE